MRPFMVLLGTVFLHLFSIPNATADVVISNNADSATNTSTNTFTVRFITTKTSNVLSSISLVGTGSDTFGWTLTTDGGATTVASESNVTMNNGLYSFNNVNPFGSGEYWLTLSSLNLSTYKHGLSSTLTATDPSWISLAGMVVGNGSATNLTDLNNSYSVSLTIAVPEPGTMALGAIALVGGGMGTWWRRRRKAEATREARE